MWLPWQWAVVLAVVLAALGLLTRPVRPLWVGASAFAREAALIAGLYSLWQLAGTLSVMQVDGALDRGRAIWDFQQALHLPSELAVQAAALPHRWLIQGSNLYYAGAHAPALGIFLVWLFLRHRHQYPPWRNVIAILTFVCLAIQLIPVAPPRLLPELGFVDTAHLYGQSVYGAVVGSGSFDQLSAMPSVHVGWAVAIGVAVVLVSTSRWRWLVLAHPIATAYVVVVTANHWWLDGIVAVAILVAGMAIVQRLTGLAGARRRDILAARRRTLEPTEAPVEVSP
jgi:hypothetical protein